MSKITLVGKICTPVVAVTVGQNNTNGKKFVVQVSSGGSTGNNPRVDNQNNSNVKNSFFSIMAFGKISENAFAKGQTIQIDGRLEISEFQMDSTKPPKQAAIVTPEHVTMLQGNIAHYAKAYNMLGNLVSSDAEVYNATSMNIYSQKIAINKRVGENDYPSFYKIKFFGDRGEKLFSKQLLNKIKVKKVLVDGTISATYTDKEKNGQPITYFNCEINVNDFQIAQFSANDGQQNQGGNFGNKQQNGFGQQGKDFAAGNSEQNIAAEQIPEINIDEIDEDQIPF